MGNPDQWNSEFWKRKENVVIVERFVVIRNKREREEKGALLHIT